MSNRQARREQMRGNTPQRPSPNRPGAGRPNRPTPPPIRRSGSGLFTLPFMILVGALVLAAVGVLAFVILSDSSEERYAKELKEARAVLPVDMQSGFKLGRDDAPVKLAAFEDFQCPFCLQYTATEEPQIIETYVKAGKVQLIFQNLPILGADSVNAAKGTVCAAAQNKFWEFHSKLFTLQAESGQATNEQNNVGRFADAKLKDYAREVGLDGAQFDTCLDDPATLTAVQEQQRKATTLGFRSTPSFTLNDLPFGSGAPSTFDGWKQVLDKAIENPPSASPTAAPSATAAGSTATAAPSAVGSPAR